MTEIFYQIVKLIRWEAPMLTTYARLISNARRARTVAEREQERGKTDLSVQQTRRMALSVAAAQRAFGAVRRENVHAYHVAVGVLCANCDRAGR